MFMSSMFLLTGWLGPPPQSAVERAANGQVLLEGWLRKAGPGLSRLLPPKDRYLRLFMNELTVHMSPEKEAHTVVRLSEGCTLERRGASLELSTPRLDGFYLLTDLIKHEVSGASLGRWEAEIAGLPALRVSVEGQCA